MKILQILGIRKADYDIILALPEMFLQYLDEILRAYGEKVKRIYYDEAHLISEWGTDDFRPEYKAQARSLKMKFPNSRCVFVTATLTTRIKDDIVHTFGLSEDDYSTFTSVIDRSDIVFQVERNVAHRYEYLDFVGHHIFTHKQNSKKILIYSVGIDDAVDAFSYLTDYLIDRDMKVKNHNGLRYIEMYHSVTDKERGTEITQEFSKADSSIKVLCCTIKYGVGVDLSGVAMVILFGIPARITDLVQEVGRVCRDDTVECGLAKIYITGQSVRNIRDQHNKRIKQGKVHVLDPYIEELIENDKSCVRDIMLKAFNFSREEVPENTKAICDRPTKCEVLCPCKSCCCCSVCCTKCKCSSSLSHDIITNHFLEM